MNDKVPFIVTAEGIGALTKQHVWCKCVIGARCVDLAREFVLGSLSSRASNSGTVIVEVCLLGKSREREGRLVGLGEYGWYKSIPIINKVGVRLVYSLFYF